jgi:lauroyl/myristoyl acyltransferase
VIEGLLAEAALTLAPSLPPRAARSLARATSGLDFAFSSRRRAAVRSNLESVLGARDLRERDRTARAIFESYHRFVLEFLAQRALDARAMDTRFRFGGMETLYAALARGRGAVVSAPHVGNWELAGLAVARLGFRVHVVTGVQFHARLTGLARRLKERERILVSTPRDGFRPLLRTLHRSGLVVLLTDGDVFRRALPATLFGRWIPFPAGPALLARRSGSPLVFAHAERLRDGEHRVSFDGFELPRPELPWREDLMRLTRGAAAAQERAIRAHLDQWCVFRPLFAGRDAA